MSRRFGAALVAILVIACGSEAKKARDYTGPRFSSREDHFSIRELPDWSMRRELGSVVFQSSRPGLTRTTIAVRAVKLAGAASSDLLPGTEKVLRSLPHAHVSSAQAIDRDDFTGVAYDVRYEPSSGHGAIYERRHAVLISKDGWVFHVIHTAPAGDLSSTAEVFQDVLDSFREET